MESRTNIFDIAIVGGGLAGLATSIELAKIGYSVVVLEKEKFPFHKVCGEYVSMESWNYLHSLGLDLTSLQLPRIDTLQLTAPNGTELITPLQLGGFGISRFMLDQLMAKEAIAKGVLLIENAKVNSINFKGEFEIVYETENSTRSVIYSEVCCASYGKRSNLDVKWKRSFLNKKESKRDNYVAVKYHVRHNQEKNIIGLHHFKDGYAGISAIENDLYCFCYMTRAEQLKKSNNHIKELETNVLSTNPHLKKIISAIKKQDGFPITISQIRFDPKTTVEHNVLMLGDAAGTIAPLCGNGMSMALHSAKLVSPLIDSFLQQKLSRSQMEDLYSAKWKKHFGIRIRVGRNLQKITGGSFSTNTFISLMKFIPYMGKKVIQLTHGKPF
jgi:FAD dependent oxidoreductase.